MRLVVLIILALSTSSVFTEDTFCSADIQRIFKGAYSCGATPVGSGSTSKAYYVQNGKDRKAIIKVSEIKSQETLDRITRESDTLKQLLHPNIIFFISGQFDEQTNSFYQELEFAESGTLTAARAAFPDLFGNPRFILTLFLGIARALLYLKHRKIVHADLKFDNVVLTANNIPKLIDFDLMIHENNFDFVRGTPVFMDPRMMDLNLGGFTYDLMVDVASLGMMMYLINQCPSPPLGKTKQSLYDVVRNRKYVVREGTERTLAFLINRSRQMNPKNRLEIEEVISELESALQDDLVYYVTETTMDIHTPIRDKSEFKLLGKESMQFVAERMTLAELAKSEAESKDPHVAYQSLRAQETLGCEFLACCKRVFDKIFV